MADVARCLQPADDGTKLAIFLYADDILLLSREATTHAAGLERLTAEIRQNKLEVHPEKCHTVVIGGRAQQRDEMWAQFRHNLSQPMAHLFAERCKTMRYLGTH